MNDKPSDPTNFSLPSPVQEDAHAAPAVAPENTPAPVSSNDAVPVTSSGMPAQDRDLIEADWVRRVEQIMRESIDDPSALSQQLSLLKEEYLSSRYSKTTKQQTKDA